MKNYWWFIVLVLAVLVLGYLGRHQIKSMLGLSSSSTPVQMTGNTTQTATGTSNNIYMTKTDATKGAYLADFNGMTLYTFDKDSKGVSNCNGTCAKTWPPYTSGATAQGTMPANITVITRSDGSKQFAWKGMPLYYFSGDSKAGDLNGDGVGGFWHIVTP